MSFTLSKVSTKIRKDKETSKFLDKLKEQLKNGEFHAGRGAKKLPDTQTVMKVYNSTSPVQAVKVAAVSIIDNSAPPQIKYLVKFGVLLV